MKRLQKYKSLIRSTLLLTLVVLAVGTQFLPAAVSAASCSEKDSSGNCCPPVQLSVPTDDGSKVYVCCPLEQVKYGLSPYCIGASTTCSVHNTTVCLYQKYLNPAIQLLSAAVGVVVTITIIWSAIQFVTSESDPQKAAMARKRIIGALTALAVYFVLYGLLQFLIPGGVLNAR